MYGSEFGRGQTVIGRKMLLMQESDAKRAEPVQFHTTVLLWCRTARTYDMIFRRHNKSLYLR